MTWTYLTDPENIIEAHIPELVEDIYLSPIRSDGMDKVVLFFNDFVKGQKISEGNFGALNFPKKNISPISALASKKWSSKKSTLFY